MTEALLPLHFEAAAHALRAALNDTRDLLGADFVDCLLHAPVSEKPSDTAHSSASTTDAPRLWHALPKSALYRTLLTELLRWGTSGRFPLCFANGPSLPCDMADDTWIAQSHDAVAAASRDRSVQAFTTVVASVGTSGIGRLLGLRTTAGSVEGALPPPRERLVEAAAARAGANPALLSVAARALMKHCGRLGGGWGECFWGREDEVMCGSDRDKNGRAERMIARILDDCVWMNVHHAPGGTKVIEFRVENGHGARWQLRGLVFRGFLEPHSEEIASLQKERAAFKAGLQQQI